VPASNGFDNYHDASFPLLVDDASDRAYFLVNELGHVTHWNPGSERLFGYAPDEIIGRSMNRLLSRQQITAKRARHCLAEAAKSGRYEEEGSWVRKDRSKFWGQGVGIILPPNPGSNRGFAIVVRDLAARAQAEEDRRFVSSFIENSEDAIIGKSLAGKILSWNAAAQCLFGYTQKEIFGRSITKLIPKDRIAEERSILSRLRRHGRVDNYETVRICKDGKLIDVSISLSPIRGADGRMVGAYKIARGITARKQAEDALRQSEQLMRAILDTAADAIITIDERGFIRSVNSATEQLFGYTAAELVAKNVNRLMPEPFHREHDQYLRNYCKTEERKIIGIGREVTGQRKNGTTFPMHLSVSEVRLKDQRLFTGIVHDLTERRRLERQVMEAAVEEQRRIGQDLHDGLCQDLVGIAFSIDAVARNFTSQADGESRVKLAASVREAAAQARQLAHGLNPVDLKAGGLSAALENLAAKVTDSFSVCCTFDWDQASHVWEDITATHLYRIAQEAVSNAIKHGEASNVQISLAKRGASLVLSVIDNGKGMPKAVIDSVKRGVAFTGSNKKLQTGMGLQTMHYRARVIGGTFTVIPHKGRGTSISCTINRELAAQLNADSEIPQRVT
jgi:PAS domain S-box-containing protein